MPDPVAGLSLIPKTAFGATAARRETIGQIVLAEVTDRALVSIALRSGEEAGLKGALKSAFGLDLPKPLAVSTQGPFRIFSSGQAQWMLEAPYASHEDLARIVSAPLRDFASVTEQTDGWVQLEVAGPDLLRLFERLCAVDMRAHSQPVATRCLMDHMGVFLVHEASKGAATILAPRSMAASLWHAVSAASHAAA